MAQDTGADQHPTDATHDIEQAADPAREAARPDHDHATGATQEVEGPDQVSNGPGRAKRPTGRSALQRRQAGSVALRKGAALGAAVLVLVAALAVPLQEPKPIRVLCVSDDVQARAVAGLANFSAWLRRNHATGFIGEIGWPSDRDAEQWSRVAEVWYEAADAIGLPVTTWAAGAWPANYPMAVYRPVAQGARVDVAGPQARIVEHHGSTPGYLRGVNLAAGSFAASDSNGGFGTTNPGHYGQDYTYETPSSYRFLAERGVRLVRLAVNWERLQPRPFGPLDATELGRVRDALGHARAAGLMVIVDLHNYGDYALGGGPAGPPRMLRLGDAALPTTALADFWRRMSVAVRNPAVIGLGLLNEPTRLAADGRAGALIWEQAAQEAVDAIRATGDRRAVLVSGYVPMGPPSWGQMHPTAWIDDPAHRVAYESHAYFDHDGSGHYWMSYEDELRSVTWPPPAHCQRLTPLARQVLTA
ncbi:glycoside hydrolase family 5 protein [Dactylosporangium sp. CA-233914]|uniref:glycoside hydrolase family 5 protein n=1 Tax=Dactylosporangium sp. CA-233914 TaxID=3239934 RepID=UPI003D910F58